MVRGRAIAAALLLLAATAPQSLGQDGVIHGVVRDSVTRLPVANTVLVLGGSPRETVSGGAGEFMFDRLGPGKYTLTAVRLGYRPTKVVAGLGTEGDTAWVDVLLPRLPPGFEIVLDPEPVQPPCGKGRSRAQEWLQTLDRAARGRFRLDDDGELRSITNAQLCAYLYAVAVRYVADHELWHEWAGEVPDLQWSRVIALALRVERTAIVDLGVYEPTPIGTPDPDRPHRPETRIFVLIDLSTLTVLGADILRLR